MLIYIKILFKKRILHRRKNIYVIPTRKLLALKKELLPKIEKGHGIVCENKNLCNPHKFKKCMEQITNFLLYSIEEEKVFMMRLNFFPMMRILTFLVGRIYQ